MDCKNVVEGLGLAAAVAVVMAFAACDNGSSGSTGTGTGTAAAGTPTSSSGGPAATGATAGSGGPAGSSGSGAPGLTCPTNYCMVGKGGYNFAYSDSENMTPQLPGTSKATLATDGSLCISGNVMALPANPTAADQSNDWGCGVGVNLDQAMGKMTAKNAYTLTGTGVTVNVSNLPSCTQARIVLDQNGASPGYCAALTPGVEIPWSAFNTQCWNNMGTALTGPPMSQAIKIQFVTSATACTFTNFCVTSISL